MKQYFKSPSRFMAVQDVNGVDFCINIDVASNSIEWIQFDLVKSIYMVFCTKEEVQEAFSKVVNSLSLEL